MVAGETVMLNKQFVPSWYQVEFKDTLMPHAFIHNETELHNYTNNGYKMTPVTILYQADYDLMHRELKEQQKYILELERSVTQQRKDWLAILRAIAEVEDITTEPDSIKWADADDEDITQEFDPWNSLKNINLIMMGDTLDRMNVNRENEPTEPGWWAFEGSKWTSRPIYEKDGIEYDEWQEEWTEYAEEHWNRYELPYIDIVRYEKVRGEPYQTVYQVKWIKPGMQISAWDHAGPYSGEPILGYVDRNQGWSPAIRSLDTVIGKWTKLNLPWENK